MVIKHLIFFIISEILNLNWRKLNELEKWFHTEPILFQAERPVKFIVLVYAQSKKDDGNCIPEFF